MKKKALKIAWWITFIGMIGVIGYPIVMYWSESIEFKVDKLNDVWKCSIGGITLGTMNAFIENQIAKL